MMLDQIRLMDYRAIKDSGHLQLSKLNVFIGPNNAGKSSLIHAIELFLKGMARSFDVNPLPIEGSPSFVSFDSVLRKHWGPKKTRSSKFKLIYHWHNQKGEKYIADYEFSSVGEQGITNVDKLTITQDGKKNIGINYNHKSKIYELDNESIDKYKSNENLFFRGIYPALPSKDMFFSVYSHTFFSKLEVVNPSRPIPKSIYVLDDPNLATEDRLFLTMLADMWQSTRPQDERLRATIIDSLKVLNLSNSIEIKKKYSHNLIEIRVFHKSKRQALTIADVGFGLSQVLPLIVQNAKLNNGVLIVYQPELHLHPFAQSRLADLFCASIARGNQIFVETHSPDLILRLQYLILHKMVSNDDIRIFCLNNEDGETKIHNIKFNETGSPSIPWPKGFLDTSINISREIAQKRLEITNA